MLSIARLAAMSGALVLGCGPAPRLPERLARIEGTLALPASGRGDAYLVLFESDGGPATLQPLPRYATAIPELRLAAGDGRFVFARVAPGAYRLQGFVDTDRDLQADLDVLVQPGAGDRPVAPVELVVEAGERVTRELALGAPYAHGPPAFRVETSATTVELPDQPLVPPSLTLVADASGLPEEGPPRFAVSLVDADGDGEADDANGDGIPELSPRFFLRFLPRPGQTVPVHGSGRRMEVVVPLLYNPAPFLLLLGGDVSREVSAERLQAVVVPQAQAVASGPDGALSVIPLPAIPVGEYELWALSRTGQYWRVPNALGGEAARKVGGPFPGQGLGFRFVHGLGLGGPPGPPP